MESQMLQAVYSPTQPANSSTGSRTSTDAVAFNLAESQAISWHARGLIPAMIMVGTVLTCYLAPVLQGVV